MSEHYWILAIIALSITIANAIWLLAISTMLSGVERVLKSIDERLENIEAGGVDEL